MLTKTEYNLDSEIVKEICQISSKYTNINKVVLFGSRARKDNSPKSDIDLAIYTESNSVNLLDFIYDIENNTTTLLEFDFSNMSEIRDDFFIEQVESEGITLYEKY